MTTEHATTEVAPQGTVPQIAGFRALCAERAGRELSTPQELHAFSVDQPTVFWRALLDWADLPWSGSAETVLVGDQVETARFFPDLRLNHAEVLLRELPAVDDDAPALTAVHAGRPDEVLTRRELRAAVRRTATALSAAGLGRTDRVVLVAANTAQAAVAALGVTALGATLSTATPDMGAGALLGRFEQVEPVLLLLDRTGMSADVVLRLVTGLPTLHRVLALDAEPLPEELPVPVGRLADLVARDGDGPAAGWPRVPFDSPLFVMFSSGTTGRPKAIVHGVGGTLLEHVKEHRLHGDLRSGDTMYFHTTTAWMMWHWQLSALAVGAHIVVYDGPPPEPPTLWRLVADHGATAFGTSPAYLQLCQDARYRPADDVDLRRLRAVMSTGAVLYDWQFDWVADAVGPVPLQSISGGTDIIGCFVLGHPELPVHRGRCQSRSLGLDVAAVDAAGREVIGQVGDLVCRRPFPSRPVGFLRDPDGSRFHAAYFGEHPGMWTHGDLIDFDTDGTARLHGRADGVLNVDGIRIGPSEIYTAIRELPQVADAMAVEQRDPRRPGASRMVLLVVLRPGHSLDDGLGRTIRRTIRQEASAAHVPAVVAAVPALPYTHNGKRSEKAARDAIHGADVVNADALRNPECLETIRAAVAAADGPDGDEPGRVATASQQVTTTSGTSALDLLTPLWCEVLGVPRVDPDDEFSDLGGTSRQAVQLLRRVALELAADVPIGTFYRRPTLRGLAEAVANARAGGVVRVPLLRQGNGAPLYVVADYLGQFNSYHRLVEGLTITRPVYGVAPSVLDEQGFRRPISQVVEETMELLQDHRPGGPYRLIGYSFGGLVAFEAAVRLRAAGETVAYLGLLDVHPPESLLTARELSAKRAATAARRLRKLMSREGAGATRTYVSARNPRGSDLELRLYHQSWDRFHAFRPSGPYDGAVTYYLARDRLLLVGNSLAAWRRVAAHLLVTEVPGSHGTLLDGTNVEELAARVSATLT